MIIINQTFYQLKFQTNVLGQMHDQNCVHNFFVISRVEYHEFTFQYQVIEAPKYMKKDVQFQ